MCKLRSPILAITSKFDWLPGLVSRLTIAGVIFIQTGWGKLHHLDKVIQFFAMSLGIPAPQIQAPFVAGVEFGGGLLVLMGLFTRFVAAVPLIGTMVVAILTAKMKDVHELSDLLKSFRSILFIVLLIWCGSS